MNIYLRELRAHWKGLLIWSLSLVAYVNMAMVKFNATVASGGSMEELMQAMPQALRNMMGIGIFDMSTPIGFYSLAFVYLLLLGGIHGGMLGATVLSSEERDKTSEFLMVRPVTRNRVILGKLLAALTHIVLFDLVVFLSSLSTLNRYGTGDYTKDVGLLLLGFFVCEVVFLVVGFFFSSVLPSPRLAPSLTMVVLVSTFLLTILAAMFEELKGLLYLSPFGWMDPKYLLGLVDMPVLMWILPILLVLVLLPLGVYRYNRRDLSI